MRRTWSYHLWISSILISTLKSMQASTISRWLNLKKKVKLMTCVLHHPILEWKSLESKMPTWTSFTITRITHPPRTGWMKTKSSTSKWNLSKLLWRGRNITWSWWGTWPALSRVSRSLVTTCTKMLLSLTTLTSRWLLSIAFLPSPRSSARDT